MTAELSTPPERDVPTGTSERSRMRTEFENVSANLRCHDAASAERSTLATASERFQ